MIRKGLLLSAPILAVIIAISAYGWNSIEPGSKVATHWSLEGEVNGYTRKEPLLLMNPAIALGLTILFALVPLIDPRQQNLRKSAEFYLVGWIGGLVVITAVHAMIVHSAVSGAPPEMAIINVTVGLFIALIGNFMAKSRSNWFAGLRTPWTLSSEHSWTIANRFSGWILVLTGLGSVAATFLTSERHGVIIFLAGTATALLAGVVISYFAWRADPDRKKAD